jgi:hypothetical protein
VLIKDLEDTGVSDPAREAATQRQADTNRRLGHDRSRGFFNDDQRTLWHVVPTTADSTACFRLLAPVHSVLLLPPAKIFYFERACVGRSCWVVRFDAVSISIQTRLRECCSFE